MNEFHRGYRGFGGWDTSRLSSPTSSVSMSVDIADVDGCGDRFRLVADFGAAESVAVANSDFSMAVGASYPGPWRS